jgi:hypothetical protein
VNAPESGGRPFTTRRAFAAAHVVADHRADNRIGAPAQLDWDATLAFRRYLWSLGFGVAEAMDTAQRGAGLDPATARELIVRSCAAAADEGGAIACGAGTDILAAGPAPLARIVDAYRDQCDLIAGAGGQPVLMASRQLAQTADGPAPYLKAYGDVLDRVEAPVILHWLGAPFDPQLAGYWGHADPWAALAVVVELIERHRDAVDGIKVSVLDAALEVELRRRLPAGVHLYTGDDWNYPRLIAGDENGHSDALLGIFAAIAPVAATALRSLDDGHVADFSALITPTVPLARHLFSAPTGHYKTGIVFLAWLNGHQAHFQMVGGLQSARSATHLLATFRLASEAGVLIDPERAAARVAAFRRCAGL